MVVGEGGDLRQMGDAEHLTATGECRELSPDDFRDRAADPGIDLVENHGRRVDLFESHRLDRQHDARELAAGGDTTQHALIFARVGRKEELQGVGSARGKRGRFGRESCLEARVLHAERAKLLDDPRLQPRGSGAP